MFWNKALLVLVVLGCIAARPALAQVTCSITQITDSVGGASADPSLDGGSIAFRSNEDLTGENPNSSSEIFLWDGSTLRQITHSSLHSVDASLDRGSIAFSSRGELTGNNPDLNFEIFLWDGSTIRQITEFSNDPGDVSSFSDSLDPSLDRGSIAFRSSADLTGGNPDRNSEIFLWDGSALTQVTDSTALNSFGPSLDGGAIAFQSGADLTGENPEHNTEVFLYEGSTIRQITSSTRNHSANPSLDAGWIAFTSSADLTGGNPGVRTEIFLYDGASIRQITDSSSGAILKESHSPSLDGGWIAFQSPADHTGENPDGSSEIFLWDGATITQVTNGVNFSSRSPSLSGGSIAYRSSTNPTGQNRDHNSEIFLASCVPALPAGPFLTSPEVPGFRFKVRVSAGDEVFEGREEPGCVEETLCVSGALAGRTEVFVRIIGPRPNGFLWTNVVRFTPSRVEVWAEQIATGRVRYYDLQAIPRGSSELTGLVDRTAFEP